MRTPALVLCPPVDRCVWVWKRLAGLLAARGRRCLRSELGARVRRDRFAGGVALTAGRAGCARCTAAHAPPAAPAAPASPAAPAAPGRPEPPAIRLIYTLYTHNALYFDLEVD